MCGLYGFYPGNDFYERFNIVNRLERLEAHYNVAPGYRMPVVTCHSQNSVEVMKWGLIPHWAKDPSIGYKLINARAESVSEKPAFRPSFLAKRCLVPSSGFYEWEKTDDGKIPYHVTLKNKEMFSFAGLYDSWFDPEGKEIKTYTIITVEPNELVKAIHNRMPALLNKKEEGAWLDSGNTDTA